MSTPKTATLLEAEAIYTAGDWVYSNPCNKDFGGCGKDCSTPTKELWRARVEKYGSVKAMYSEYKCQKCRKIGAPPKVPYVSKKVEKPIIEKPVDVPIISVSLPAEAPKPIVAKPTIQPAQIKSKSALPTIDIAPVRRDPNPCDAVKAPPNSIGFSVWETSTDGRVFKGTTWMKLDE